MFPSIMLEPLEAQVNVDRKSAELSLARLVRSDTFEASSSIHLRLFASGMNHFLHAFPRSVQHQGMMNAMRITTDISNAYTGLLPVENNQYIYDSLFPTMAYVGSGRLLVDSIEFPGRLTYSPLADAWPMFGSVAKILGVRSLERESNK